jgi:flagellar assembly factor FliW
MSASAALATPAPDLVIVPSDILGPLTLPDDRLLSFPAGLLGLPECRNFVLLPTERDGFFWLQSGDHSALAFLLVDPFLFFDGYSIELGPRDLRELCASEDSDVAVLAIVTFPADRGQPATVNLQGPLAIHLDSRLGKQLVVENSVFGLRASLDLSRAPGE